MATNDETSDEKDDPRNEVETLDVVQCHLDVPCIAVSSRLSTEDSFPGDTTDATTEVSGQESWASRISSPVQSIKPDHRKDWDALDTDLPTLAHDDSPIRNQDAQQHDLLTGIETLQLVDGQGEPWQPAHEQSLRQYWESPEIPHEDRMNAQRQTSCLGTASSTQDAQSNSQARKRKPRPKNAKRQAKDRERLTKRINKQNEGSADRASLDLHQYSSEQHDLNAINNCSEEARPQCALTTPNHLGLPLYLKPSPTVPEPSDADFVPRHMTRCETWNHLLDKQIEQKGFPFMNLYPSMAERIKVMVETRRTVPQDDLTARYMPEIPENEETDSTIGLLDDHTQQKLADKKLELKPSLGTGWGAL